MMTSCCAGNSSPKDVWLAFRLSAHPSEFISCAKLGYKLPFWFRGRSHTLLRIKSRREVVQPRALNMQSDGRRHSLSGRVVYHKKDFCGTISVSSKRMILHGSEDALLGLGLWAVSPLSILLFSPTRRIVRAATSSSNVAKPSALPHVKASDASSIARCFWGLKSPNRPRISVPSRNQQCQRSTEPLNSAPSTTTLG